MPTVKKTESKEPTKPSKAVEGTPKVSAPSRDQLEPWRNPLAFSKNASSVMRKPLEVLLPVADLLSLSRRLASTQHGKPSLSLAWEPGQSRKY
jgi:hypothetical protein